MYFVTAVAVTVDNAIGIHTICHIFELRIVNQHVIELLRYNLLVKVNIAFRHEFNKEFVDIDVAFFGNLDNIFCRD